MIPNRITSLFAVVFFVFAGPAQADELFTVSGVALDQQAATAQDARQAALRAGRLDAWERLLDRLVPSSARGQVPALEPRQVEALVRDFSLGNEQTSRVRYLADMTVRFDPDLVRAELRAARVPFSETQSRSVLILPVLQASAFGGSVLWEDSNPWRRAWERLGPTDGLVPITTALGDLEDFSSVGPADALNRTPETLAFLKLKYGVQRVVTVLAQVEDTFNGRRARIRALLPQTRDELRTVSILVDGRGGQSLDELMSDAVTATQVVIEDDWKSQTQLNFDEFGLLTAMVPLANLSDWLQVKDRLTQLPMIERVQLQAMTRDRAQVTVYFIGLQDQLDLAMAQADLDLIWTTDVWTIAPAGDQRPGEPGPQPAIR